MVRFFDNEDRSRPRNAFVQLGIEYLDIRIAPAVLTWTGKWNVLGGGNVWGNVLNWKDANGNIPVQAPAAGDSVVFNAAGTGDSVDDLPQIANLTITGGYNGTISTTAGQSFTVTGTLQIDTAKLSMSANSNIIVGNLAMTGGMIATTAVAPANTVAISPPAPGGGAISTISGGTFSAQTTLTVSAGSALTMDGNVSFNTATINNYGVVNWNSGTISFGTGTVANNYGTFALNSDSPLADRSLGAPTGIFNNFGSFVKNQGANGSGSLIGVVFNNKVSNGINAVLMVNAGTLFLDGGADIASPNTLAPGGVLQLGSLNEIQTLENGAVLSGNIVFQSSVLVPANAFVTLTGSIRLATGLGFNEGLGGAGTLALTGAGSTLQWTSGRILKLGNLLISSGTQMQISGNNPKELIGTAAGTISTISNGGTITWSGADITSYSSDINNAGNFVVSSDASVVFPNGGLPGGEIAPTFENTAGATFHKTGGAATGATALNLAFANTGGAFTIDPNLNVTFPATGSFQQNNVLSTLLLQGGNLTVANGLNAALGLVSAYGTITGDLTVGGSLDMGGGNQVQILTVTGNFVQTGGTITFKVTAANTSDSLVVQGTNQAQLAGSLQINPVGNYAPAMNDQFQVFTAAGGFNGNYANPNGYTATSAGNNLTVTKN